MHTNIYTSRTKGTTAKKVRKSEKARSNFFIYFVQLPHVCPNCYYAGGVQCGSYAIHFFPSCSIVDVVYFYHNIKFSLILSNEVIKFVENVHIKNQKQSDWEPRSRKGEYQLFQREYRN